VLRNFVLALACGVLLSVTAPPAGAVPPCDRLFPATTKAFASVDSVPTFIDHYLKTEFGQLLEDPDVRPFRDDLDRQIRDKGLELQDRLGLSLEDLDGLATGEMAIGIVQGGPHEAVVTLLVDVSQSNELAQKVLAKVATSFQQLGGVHKSESAGGTTLQIYDIPADAKKKRPARQVAYFLSQGMLGMAERTSVARDIANRLQTPDEASLSGLPAYQAVQKRAAAGNKLPVDVHWYLDPFGLSEIGRSRVPKRQQASRDPVKLAKGEGFDAVKALGGVVSLASGPYGAVHRTCVYAPPPYQRAMRMLVLPNGGNFAPPSWVPTDIATFTTLHWDIQVGFDNFGTLFDALFGEGEEGVWPDVLLSIETDPNGPQLNIRKDLVAHLGQRLTLLTDTQMPITTHSQRRLFAIETTQPEKLAQAIDKSMKNDKDVRKINYEGHQIYEIIDEEAAAAAKAGTQKGAPRAGQGERILPNSAVAVAHGQLFVATHLDLLKKVLSAAQAPQPLAADADYLQVKQHFAKLCNDSPCMEAFSRNVDKWLLSYELFRQGKLPEADMLLAQVLNGVLNDSTEGETRKPMFDGSKLPPYDIVRRYLGTGGIMATSDRDGWLIVGFSLSKNGAPQAEARVPGDVK
jgi:hypothetical protein